MTSARPHGGIDADDPRVLMLVTRNQRRGAESSAMMLAGRLRDHGFDIALRSLAGSSNGSPLAIESIGRRTLGPVTLLRLHRQMRTNDLLVACGSKTLPASVLAGVRTGCPIIYQNIGDPLFWAPSRAKRGRVRALLQRTSAVAALTEQSAHVFETVFGIARDRIAVIRNARSSTEFRPAGPDDKRRARLRLGVPSRVSIIVMVGALSPEKYVDHAIRAVGRMDPAVKLVVAGEGPLLEELTRLAEKVAPHRVIFLGRRADIRSVYWAADALVLTSASEGVPGVLIEAGLCGLPVVSTDVGYVRDVVDPGTTGYLIPFGDLDGLAHTLQDALDHRVAMGAASRRRCVDLFDIDLVTAQWASLLLTVLGNRGSDVDR